MRRMNRGGGIWKEGKRGEGKRNKTFEIPFDGIHLVLQGIWDRVGRLGGLNRWRWADRKGKEREGAEWCIQWERGTYFYKCKGEEDSTRDHSICQTWGGGWGRWVGWWGDVLQHHAQPCDGHRPGPTFSKAMQAKLWPTFLFKLIPLLCLLPTSILLAVSCSSRRCSQYLVHCENQWRWTRVENIWTWYFSFSFSFSFSLSFASPSPPPLLSSLPFPSLPFPSLPLLNYHRLFVLIFEYRSCKG